MKPNLTVVVLCYNHDQYVAKSIESILSQTYRDLTIIVLDDASTDRSSEVIERTLAGRGSEVRFIKHVENRGQCVSLNEVLAQIDTPFYSVVSGDDWSEPDRFERSMAEIQRLGEEYAAVYTDIFTADKDGNRDPESVNQGKAMPSGKILAELIEHNSIAAPGVLLRTDSVRLVGGYDETLPVEDYDLWLRLAAKFKIGYLDVPLATWRIVPGSLFDSVGDEYFRRSRFHSLPKHLGVSREIDDRIYERLAINAKWLYMEGVDPKDLVGIFKLVARGRTSPRSLGWFIAASLRVPGGWIRAAASLARRRGNVHPVKSRW